MNAAFLWALTFGLGGAAVVSEFLTGTSNLSVGLALCTVGVALIALVVDDEPSRHRDRRPW